jgi:hypothetical protein
MKRIFDPTMPPITTHTARSIASLRRRTPSAPPHSRSASLADTRIAAANPAISINP